MRSSCRRATGSREDASENPEAVYDLLEQVAPAMPICTASPRWSWRPGSPDPEKPATQVPIRIAHPNRSLKYDERDLKLRAMLEASGIELKEPSGAAPA